MPARSKWQKLPTEAINPASLGIDKMSPSAIVDLMIDDDREILAAVRREQKRIALGARIATQCLRNGGRIIFVGAGTSGRLGVLEAVEMPPTFGTPPRLVQAVMAGGQDAVHRAKEGVEDDYDAGARAAQRLRPRPRDVMIGVTASGTTPFVRGALTRARKAGAKIIAVTCDPSTEMRAYADVSISLAVGPEVIAGSTRLKAGSATKLVLNILTTAAMVGICKTYGNLMVDVQARSDKLRDRARRILQMVTGLDDEEADALLRRAKLNVKTAIVMHKRGLTRAQAAARLRRARGSVRSAVGEDVEPRLRKLLEAV